MSTNRHIRFISFAIFTSDDTIQNNPTRFIQKNSHINRYYMKKKNSLFRLQDIPYANNGDLLLDLERDLVQVSNGG
ncbi:hypothetical protein MIMGU_mgv1a017436mg [Erythranthe guttata]|uniref:Uncharacterized protein n=1 Tax=Erythranthe guttata TaxID=4155 RepID=A0A022RNE3_ERYGU|nr:hypothetical protein MIMGU_mgv1a017436mg [Erythranthe guttata]